METNVDLLARYIDKVDYTNTFHDIAGERKHSIAMVAGDRLQMLNDLLCTVHRAGGQYIAEHGYKKATEDAMKIIASLVQQDD